MLSNVTIYDYYRLNFVLFQHHKYPLSEIENMMLYERDVYVDMLIAYLEKKNKDGTG